MVIPLSILAFLVIVPVLMYAFRGSSNTLPVTPADIPKSHFTEPAGIPKIHFTKNDILKQIENIKYDSNNLANCLEYIKTRVDFLSQIDHSRQAFGSGRWGYTFREVSELEIAKAEAQAKKALPREFRQFLLAIGFGAAPVYGISKHARLTVEWYDAEPDADEEDKMYEAGYIVVSEHGCGIESRLCLADDHYGEIWRCDALSDKTGDNYVDWYINWVNNLLYIFAEGEYIGLRSGSF